MIGRKRWPAPRAGRRHLATPAALLTLCGLFAVALLVPLPTAPNTARAQVVSRVEDRLPGWNIVRADASWEGAWTVVAACGEREVGFQLVPGHGLAPGDLWLQPEDRFSRTRLQAVSDLTGYLIWFRQGARSLSCRSELARQGQRAVQVPNLD
jgi:hypothetical protein